MWELRNRTAFKAAWTIAVDKSGEKSWVVVVRGTFDITPNGGTRIAEEQLEPSAEPVYRGAPGESSLIQEQDLIPAKPRTDIYVDGHAHAPQGRPCTEMTVSLSTPAGRKSLLVRGDRTWERNLVGLVEPSPPLPFVKMPIVWERTYGGYDRQDPDEGKHRLDPRNPVGTGFFTSLGHRVGRLAPNIEPLGGGDEPVGFGALCSYWQPRIGYQGTYDGKWLETRKPLLPLDYDPQFLQCAPRDQQAPHLRGGEPIAVVGMSPSGSLGFSVPKHYLAFTTHIGSDALQHRAKINTVLIEPDYPRVSVVWHTTLACHHRIDDIDATEIVEKPYV